ncbi:hypothetical protein [Endozoicomonas sp.]|uniref:hypothetical protein n=1 Tax=Endozoicomonas sp. TaxID=1892382 RepID=UPI00383A2B31
MHIVLVSWLEAQLCTFLLYLSSVPLVPAVIFVVGAGFVSSHIYDKITAPHAEPTDIAVQLTNDNKAKTE